jgi:membrane protein
VLREVFDLRQERGIIEGKLFDIKMVVTAGTLLALNVGLTIVLEIVAEFGLGILDLEPGEVRAIQLFFGRVLAFLAIWAMFLLIYRFLPMRRIHWRTAVVAATFTAVLFEVMKFAFGWYATNVANYRSTYGSLTALIILFLWIYYTAVVFILGGEVAQVVAMRRIRRRQRERLR